MVCFLNIPPGKFCPLWRAPTYLALVPAISCKPSSSLLGYWQDQKLPRELTRFTVFDWVVFIQSSTSNASRRGVQQSYELELRDRPAFSRSLQNSGSVSKVLPAAAGFWGNFCPAQFQSENQSDAFQFAPSRERPTSWRRRPLQPTGTETFLLLKCKFAQLLAHKVLTFLRTKPLTVQ